VSRTPGWVRAIAAVSSIATVLSGICGSPGSARTPSADARWSESILDEADVHLLDPFLVTAAVVADLHARRRVAVCHLRPGLWEPDRPDAGRFEASAIGAAIGAMDDARWLDVRRWDALADVLDDRLGLCMAKGFDGVALSDLDGYAHPTGFPLTHADQDTFSRALADLARRRGLVAVFDPPDR
jgi:hypothetical protein